MEKLIYVTGNYGKYVAVKKKSIAMGLDVDFFQYDLDELEINDVTVVSKDKASKAYQLVQNPCFVRDSGFYIEDYPGCPNYPGTLVKRSGISNNIEELLAVMKDVSNRNCKFVDCLTYYDGDKHYQFISESPGKLAYSKSGVLPKDAYSRLWEVFVPEGSGKTLAAMTDEERRIRDHKKIGTVDKFFQWWMQQEKEKTLLKVKKSV